jgi:hypothetical protein
LFARRSVNSNAATYEASLQPLVHRGKSWRVRIATTRGQFAHFPGESLKPETRWRMTQSDANCSPSTCQPVDTQAVFDKAAVDAESLGSACESRTMLLFVKEVRTRRANLGVELLTYYVRQRTCDALKAARMHACRNYCRNEADPPQHAVAAGTTLGTLGLSRSPTPRLPEERAPCARLFRPARCLSWTAKMRFPRTQPSPSGDSGDCRLQM